MKKKIVMLFALLITLSACAQAGSFMETYTLGDRDTINVWYECEEFEGTLPGGMSLVFESLLRKGDEIICGADMTAHLYSDPDMDWGAQALIAVRREGKILLMSARRVEGEWHAVLETDSFLDPQAEFDIAVEPQIGYFGFQGASLAIVTDDGAYRIEIHQSGAPLLREFRKEQADGTTLTIDNYAGFLADISGAQGRVSEEAFKCPAPYRLAAWTQEAFPKSIEAIRAWVAAHPVELEEDEAYISGVNFREKPTGESRSMGRYSAKVTVLGSEPGLQAPWYHVRVGDTQGWVSGDYLVREGDDDVRFYGLAEGFFSVARADEEIALRIAPDGKTKQSIPKGTRMHVICENEGWLHVVIPREEIAWNIDWDGTYGFVKAGEVTQGETLTELKWK